MTGLTVRRLLVLALVIVSGVRVAAGQPGVASDITRQPSGIFSIASLVKTSLLGWDSESATYWFTNPSM